MKNITPTLILTAALALLTSGCGDTEKPQAAAPSVPVTPETPPVELPATLIAEETPADAVGVVEARKSVEPGKEIVLTGFVGGRANPFVDDRAIFTLADSKLVRCDARPGDECETPWDACCDEPGKIKASIASIQVVDGEGRVLKRPLEGFGRIAAGSTVTVKGTIAAGSSADSLVVNAGQIHVTPKP